MNTLETLKVVQIVRSRPSEVSDYANKSNSWNEKLTKIIYELLLQSQCECPYVNYYLDIQKFLFESYGVFGVKLETLSKEFYEVKIFI